MELDPLLDLTISHTASPPSSRIHSCPALWLGQTAWRDARLRESREELARRTAVDSECSDADAEACLWVRASATAPALDDDEGWVLAQALVGAPAGASSVLSAELVRVLTADAAAPSPSDLGVEIDPNVVWPASLAPCARVRIAPHDAASRRTASLLCSTPRLARGAATIFDGEPVALHSVLALALAGATPALFRVVALWDASGSVRSQRGHRDRIALRVSSETAIEVESAVFVPRRRKAVGAAAPFLRSAPDDAAGTAAEVSHFLRARVGGADATCAQLAALVASARCSHARWRANDRDDAAASGERAEAAPPLASALLSIAPPIGVLLTGGSGVGKSALLEALAACCAASQASRSDRGASSALTAVAISASELLLGDGEAALRRAFRRARDNAPALLLIDDLELVGAARPFGITGLRLCEQLLACIDALSSSTSSATGAGGCGRCGVAVIGATARPLEISAELRLPGRLEIALQMSTLGTAARAAVLRICMRPMRLEGDDGTESGTTQQREEEGVATTILATLAGELALKTPGFTGADLRSLCQHAALAALSRCPRSDAASLAAARVSAVDWRYSLETVRPAGLAQVLAAAGDGASSLRSDVKVAGSASSTTLPASTSAAIFMQRAGTLAGASEAFAALLFPLQNPNVFRAMGIQPPKGVLLHGPSGCGKSTLAMELGR